jgi:MurNAc alpha-1-phosphate uridylyltransferase
MRAMILAAGRGERLRPISDRIPKPLISVAGRPLIAYSLGLLREAGITDVIVNLHHLGDQVENVLEPCVSLGMTIQFSREKLLLETGGGIAYAQKLIGSNTFLVLNADVICDLDLNAVLDEHVRSGAIATMVLTRNSDIDRYPPVEWNPRSHHVLDVRGEIGRRAPRSEPRMFTGIQVMEPTVFDYVIPRRESIIDAFYLPALREHRHVHGYDFSGFWADLGTKEELARVNKELPGMEFSYVKPLPLQPAHGSGSL